jgi:ABC-type phosphonate transport system ATPase subunit
VPGGDLESAVESSLRAVNLWNNKVGDKQARQYSGGMKRRLSVAISFTGNPLVVYLDEPSTVSEQGWCCGRLPALSLDMVQQGISAQSKGCGLQSAGGLPG